MEFQNKLHIFYLPDIRAGTVLSSEESAHIPPPPITEVDPFATDGIVYTEVDPLVTDEIMYE